PADPIPDYSLEIPRTPGSGRRTSRVMSTMTPRTHRVGYRRYLLRIAAFLMLVVPISVQAAATLQPPFDGEFMLVELDVPGVPPGHGGLTFVPDDPNTIVIGGRTETEDGYLYA